MCNEYVERETTRWCTRYVDNNSGGIIRWSTTGKRLRQPMIGCKK